MKRKLKDFQKNLRKKNIDCAIISSLGQKEKNIRYLLGNSIMYGLLFVPKNGNPILLVPEMEFASAKKKAKNCKIKKFTNGIAKDILSLIKRRKIESIGINESAMNVKEYRILRRAIKGKIWIDISDILLEMRSVKEISEIENIKKACLITDKIFKKLFSKLRSSQLKTEKEIESFLLQETLKENCKKAFSPVVASEKNSGYVHHTPSNKKIKKGFLLLDYGVSFLGYKSDISRTIYIGNPKKNEKELYAFLLEIQEELIKMARPGTKASELERHLRKKLGKYEKNYTHSLGHGVGLNIHEFPRINQFSDEILKKGMVLTIEPGIYFPENFGMRIEDTIVITDNMPLVLTKTTKKLMRL